MLCYAFTSTKLVYVYVMVQSPLSAQRRIRSLVILYYKIIIYEASYPPINRLSCMYTTIRIFHICVVYRLCVRVYMTINDTRRRFCTTVIIFERVFAYVIADVCT